VVQPSGEVCRVAVDVCDAADVCDGSDTACPEDVLQDSSFTCRAAAGPCDIAETCTGSSVACPTDVLQPASFVCRPQAGECDVPDYCPGTEAACADDEYVPEGTLCIGTNPNACLNACVTGVCTDGEPVTEQSCCGNGVLDQGETCDDGNQISGDSCPSLPGDDCDFAASGMLVRAVRRNPAHDGRACQLEFAVAHSSSSADRFGLPSWIQTCTDQDPDCDLDPTPGRCRFAVAACLNNDDPNLPACPLNGVGSVELTSPKGSLPAEQLELATAGVAKLTAGLEQLLDPARPDEWYTNTLPVAADQHNVCTSTVLIDVLAGTDARSAKRKAFSLKVRSRDLNGLRKTSILRLMCQQPVAP
jgi:cysteine-rich repeat protein